MYYFLSTGAALLNNFYSDLNIGSACGYLTVCNHVVLGRCSFINLSNHNTYICTCVLSHRSAEAVNELKVLIKGYPEINIILLLYML